MRSTVVATLEGFIVEDAADALAKALRVDPLYAALVADLDAHDAHVALRAYFSRSIRHYRHDGMMVELPDATLGAALWSGSALPTSECAQAPDAAFGATTEPDDVMLFGERGARLYRETIDEMSQRSATHVPADAWYLSILGVDPNTQGRGLGRQLLAPTLAEADRREKACWLETFSADNLGFYRRLGFESRGAIEVSDTPLTYHVMVRSPRIEQHGAGEPSTSE